jgi:hypothetical protein
MRDFDYDENEDFQNDIDNFFGDQDDEGIYYDKKDIIKAMELEVTENNINLKLLKTVIQTLEDSFWWRFYSFKTKLKMIARTYVVFSQLVFDKKKEK